MSNTISRRDANCIIAASALTAASAPAFAAATLNTVPLAHSLETARAASRLRRLAAAGGHQKEITELAALLQNAPAISPMVRAMRQDALMAAHRATA